MYPAQVVEPATPSTIVKRKTVVGTPGPVDPGDLPLAAEAAPSVPQTEAAERRAGAEEDPEPPTSKEQFEYSL